MFNVETMVQNNVGINIDEIIELSIDEQIDVLKTLFTIFYVKYHIDGCEEDKLMVWNIINKWVNIIGPVKYEPEVFNIVSQKVKFRIWDKPVPVDIIEEIMEKSIRVKMGHDGFEDLVNNLSELLLYLSNDNSMETNIVREICEVNSDCALSIAVQTLVIASNI